MTTDVIQETTTHCYVKLYLNESLTKCACFVVCCFVLSFFLLLALVSAKYPAFPDLARPDAIIVGLISLISLLIKYSILIGLEQCSLIVTQVRKVQHQTKLQRGYPEY